MIDVLKAGRRRLLNRISSDNLEKIVMALSRLLEVDLLLLAYHQRGILKYWNNHVSGESYVINSVLKDYFLDVKSTVFDVGANIGDYSKEIKKAFPQSIIYAFEPNINTFKSLENNLSNSDIKSFCIGLSSCTSKKNIYTYASDSQSQHASVYKEVLSDLHKAENILKIEFETISLDEFCGKYGIEKIDFLKIDTEGHELDIILGAKKLISENRIGIIQFEFNEMNIISRVFLKDFYDALPSYDIYRVDSDRLIPLFNYNSSNEIFKFQNFLAISKSLNKAI